MSASPSKRRREYGSTKGQGPPTTAKRLLNARASSGLAVRLRTVELRTSLNARWANVALACFQWLGYSWDLYSWDLCPDHFINQRQSAPAKPKLDSQGGQARFVTVLAGRLAHGRPWWAASAAGTGGRRLAGWEAGAAALIGCSRTEGAVAVAVGSRVAELRRRNTELESDIQQLRRGRIAELESETELLRRRGRREGNHEVLPVSVPPATVDLSRVDTSPVTQISSFLGTSHELINLALTCKSFGWRQPTSSLNWSLVEEVARQAVCSKATDAEMSSLPQYFSGTTTWLSILHRFERPLLFDVLLGGDIEYRNGDKATVHCHMKISTALSSGYVMSSGSHYAEYEIIAGSPFIGVVRPMPGLDAGSFGDSCFFVGRGSFYPTFLAQGSAGWGACSNVHACEYNCHSGEMNWTDWEDEERLGLGWEGREGCRTGDIIGMLLNLDEGTLTVYKNDRRLGVLRDGLSGSYCCWGLKLRKSEALPVVQIYARMGDDGRARSKTAEGGIAAAAAAEVAELRRRNAELESENDQLRQLPERIAELESEIEQLRRGGRREGTHDVLPVVIVPPTVDLSRVDTSLVAQISSFLGTSHELINLALTCKSFGWRQPTSSLNWSLVEEVARQAVCSKATDSEMSSLPRYVSGTTTWLSILHRFEHPLQFDVLLGNSIEYRNGDKATIHGTANTSTALSSGYVMSSGSHYAEYEIIAGEPFIGVVRPMPGLDAGSFGDYSYFVGDEPRYPTFLAQRSSGWGACSNVHACDYSCGDGEMNWTDWEEVEYLALRWEGMEGCGRGDTVGMLLNLGEGTLTVYKNSRRLGVMRDGLSGSYCWYATVNEDDMVTIKRGTPPNIDNTMST
ncbi:hypothetical protein THAOC_08889 [Thalassiosira oceanica]|uniref:B30.2/SPRY domain-containing protein n=1 Tax=Thalassiosira oceanica TaxID=159749 RepID=K0T8V9_THAOC|nr:hypothetical protein THAOC_08889 [Thalassiosira oceanica]|eukprot:EJK69816.1 hypothetical protein THAOC_08889 [Thalassiosira oceanica]